MKQTENEKKVLEIVKKLDGTTIFQIIKRAIEGNFPEYERDISKKMTVEVIGDMDAFETACFILLEKSSKAYVDFLKEANNQMFQSDMEKLVELKKHAESLETTLFDSLRNNFPDFADKNLTIIGGYRVAEKLDGICNCSFCRAGLKEITTELSENLSAVFLRIKKDSDKSKVFSSKLLN